MNNYQNNLKLQNLRVVLNICIIAIVRLMIHLQKSKNHICKEHVQLIFPVPCFFHSVAMRLGMNQAYRIMHRRILYTCLWSSFGTETPIVRNQFLDLPHKPAVPFTGLSAFEEKFNILAVQFLLCQMESEGRGMWEKRKISLQMLKFSD